MRENMVSKIRFDSIPMPKMKRTDEGYLRGEAVVSRAGVFKYRNIDGSLRGELRHPEEIFKADSLESLKMIPITNDHPPEFVDASNVHKYQVGQTGERYDVQNDQIIVSMTVTHKDAIDAIESGKLELSMGYKVDLEPERGNYDGEEYDYRQIAPKYNHLAIVERGRAGRSARMRFDDAAYLVLDDQVSDKLKNINQNSNNKIGNNNFMEKKTDTVEKKESLDESFVKKRIDTLEQENKALKDSLEKERELKADNVINKRVQDRTRLITNASSILGGDTDLHLKTDREIMEMVINCRRSDSISFDERSDEYVSGLFDGVISSKSLHRDGNPNILKAMTQKCDNADKKFDSSHEALANFISDDFYKIQYGNK